MKKTICLLVFFGCLLMSAGNKAGADETDKPSKKPSKIQSQETIATLDQNLLRNRLDTLEREMNQLEDKIRFLDERTKNLDRRVDDLRQRH